MTSLIAVLAQAAAPADPMQPSAWLFMLTVWAVIIGFTIFCFYTLLTSERQLGGAEPEEPAPPIEPDTSIQESP